MRVKDRFQYKYYILLFIRNVTELCCIKIARKEVLVNPVALEKTCVSPFPEMKGETRGECPL